jgi:cyclohexa-1,5-dienecarbonyl-CoA hydratase
MRPLTVSDPVRTEVTHDGARLRLLLDRPKANIVSLEMIGALRRVLADLPGRPALRLLTIEGAGDHFSYGASVEEHAPPLIDRVLSELHGLVRDLLAAPVPTLAVVRGRCLGGGLELVLACDLVFAAEEAVLGVPEIQLGVFPPAAAALLPARIGASRATVAVLQGETFPARWWEAAGLVARVAPGAALEAEVDRWFEQYAAPRSAVALGFAARAARQALRQVAEPALAELERLYLEQLMRTHDAAEGIAAFVAKRAPRWRHA